MSIRTLERMSCYNSRKVDRRVNERWAPVDSQQAYHEWKSAIQMRESLEADYLAALRAHDYRRVFELRFIWLQEARDYCSETLKLYRQARRVERTS